MLGHLFSNPGFMPHIHCYLAHPSLVWTMLITDLLIGIAYVGISLTLWSLVKRIKIQFSFVVLCFGLFIGACGATHFMEVWTLWNPDYWPAAFVKVLTAFASVGTGVYLLRLRHPIVLVAEAAKLSEQRRTDLEGLTKSLEELASERAKSLAIIQSQFQKVSNATDLGIWYCDLPFDKLIWNDNTKHHFWFDPSDIIDEVAFYSHIHPDDRERTRLSVASSIENHHTYDIEIRTIRPENPNHWKWIRATGWADYDPSGKPLRFDGITLDITRQKESEQKMRASELRYRTLTETLPQLIWTCLPSGDCDYLSQQWTSFTGIQAESQLGMNWLTQVIHPDDQARTREHWMGAVNGLHPYDIDYRIRRFDGVYRLFKTRGIPIRNEKDEIIYWFGTCTDIQDQLETRIKLEESVRSRDEFLSIASHELKTPLTSLRLQTQLFQRAINKNDPSIYSKPKVDQLVKQTEKQMDRLSRLVDDMLDIARIRAGVLFLERSEFNLCDLVKSCLEKMKGQFNAAGCGDPSIQVCEPVVGSWDFTRVEQAINNLFTNAVRYGKGHPVEAAIFKENGKARISVRDHGIGIAPEMQSKIFERFERAIDANEVSGLGLGLFITRQIAEAHGGQISVVSALGEGATFTLELPMAPNETDQV